MRTLAQIRDVVVEARAQRDLLESQLSSAEGKRSALARLLESQELAHALIQSVAQETQGQLKIHIEDIVQSALDVCFPEQYEFHMEFEMKRDKTECDLYVVKDGEKMNPTDSNGGGLTDAISTGLRIACLCLSQNDRTIVMDEPMKFLSSNLKPVMAELLKELSHRLGIQLIVVTHDPEFAAIADRTFEVKQKEGKSEIITKGIEI